MSVKAVNRPKTGTIRMYLLGMVQISFDRAGSEGHATTRMRATSRFTRCFEPQAIGSVWGELVSGNVTYTHLRSRIDSVAKSHEKKALRISPYDPDGCYPECRFHPSQLKQANRIAEN